MVSNPAVLEALDLSKLKLPARPRVVELEVDDYVDWTGDDSLRVQVILDEDEDVETLPIQDADDLKAAIFDALQARGIGLFPYIFLGKRSEMLAAASEV